MTLQQPGAGRPAASPDVEFVRPELVRALRLRVLRPGQPWSSVVHDYDSWPDTFHVAAFSPQNLIVACATFYPEPTEDGRAAWRLRAMASAPEVRGQGYGAACLRYGLAEVRRRGAALVWCNARSGAVGFYQRLGFAVVSDEFDIPSIGPHYVMEYDMPQAPDVLRYAAFTTDPTGGNPAGIVLDASGLPGLDELRMQQIALEVGYSETAFLRSAGDSRSFDVRYFSPTTEVAFCGHATIASGVALGERLGPGRFVFHIPAGILPVDVQPDDGGLRATLTSVEPARAKLPAEDLDAVLAALAWRREDLDRELPSGLAFAGNWHPVIAAATRQRLAALDYDVDALASLMRARGWTSLQLVWRETDSTFYARNPAPAVGILEDPATGSAAAALGHYLREVGAVRPPARLTVHQGDDMGRPSVLTVDIDADDQRIRVSGYAVPIPLMSP